MSEWGGSLSGGRPANARIPVKVHRNVALLRCADAFLADELLARPKVARHIAGRLNETVLLIWSGKAAEVVEELKKLGHTPSAVEGGA